MGRLEWRAIATVTHPILLVLGALLYGLGAAMVRYLGGDVPIGAYLLGQLIVTGLQLAAHVLDSFYAHPGDRLRPGLKLSVGSPELQATSISLRWLFTFAVGCLALAGSLTALLLALGWLTLATAVILLSLALAAVLYGMPPVRLSESGYGELTAAFFLGAGVPALSFTLFHGELHRLLLLSTPPLVALLFGSMIALSLPSFGRGGLGARKNLVARIDWPLAMRLHDVSVLLGFLLVGAALAAGLPWRVGYGALLAFPLGLAQIWYMNRIRAGAPPNWPLLIGSAYTLVCLMAYLMLAGYLLS